MDTNTNTNNITITVYRNAVERALYENGYLGHIIVACIIVLVVIVVINGLADRILGNFHPRRNLIAGCSYFVAALAALGFLHWSVS